MKKLNLSSLTSPHPTKKKSCISEVDMIDGINQGFSYILRTLLYLS